MIELFLTRTKKRLICFFRGHPWNKYDGHYNYYDDKPAYDAVCLRCGQEYEHLK